MDCSLALGSGNNGNQRRIMSAARHSCSLKPRNFVGGKQPAVTFS